MNESSQREHWHLRREFNIGHVITTLMLFAAGISAWYSTQNRISILELRQGAQEKRLEQTRDEVSSKLQRIEQKLDRLIERELDNNHGRGGQ